MKYMLMALLILGSAAANAQICDVRLTGHVEDIDTKEKLKAATVYLKEKELQVITDDEGDFVFENLCPGTYTLIVSHIGCETIEKSLILSKNRHLDIFLPHDNNALDVVTIAAERGLQNSGFKKEVSGRKLDEAKGLSISEALSKLNGVTLLQTGATISKPMIHGLHSNRILTINNGVRQEGQQWGNEHAPEIDPFLADKLVVIKGVDELKYGSDAIGGVILVEPKPLRNSPGFSGEINAGAFSNNKQYYASAIIEHQLKKLPSFTYRIQGTFKRAANIKTADYRLNNTAVAEENFSLTAGYRKEKFSLETFFSQFHTKAGIFSGSHIGNLTDLLAAIEKDKPDDIHTGNNAYDIDRPSQEVLHRLFKLRSNFSRGQSRFHATFAAQYNNRKEFDVSRNANNIRPQLDLSILTLTEDLAWDHPAFSNFRGTIGLSFMQQENGYQGRYFIPNYNSSTAGGYIIEKWSKHRWDIQAGIRYDFKSVDTRRLLYNGGRINHVFDFSTMGSSFNASYKAAQRLRFNGSISIASRAPHVNELLSNGIHHGTATYEEGNLSLKPERSSNFGLGLTYSNVEKTFEATLDLYHNKIDDFIYRQPKPDEPVLTIAGAFPKIVYEQTNVRLQGADLAFNATFNKKINWLGKASLLRARNLKTDDWLILMPSDRISNELVYTFSDNRFRTGTYASIEVANVFRQKRVPSDKDGRQDYKEAPAGYSLVSLNASSNIIVNEVPVRVGIAVTNLLNTSYREYLNSFRYYSDDMGRNISLRVTVPIGSSLP